ncbi:MAG: hypothetical protein AB1401_00635 [Thermodesulfobacteriota bacterium]
MPRMKKVVEEILTNHGLIDKFRKDEFFHARIESPGFMRLVIERLGGGRVSVAHYYEQNGDLMADPDIVFDMMDHDWVPVEYTQHNLGIYQRVVHDKGGQEFVDIKLQKSIASFANGLWAKNLKHQGFADPKQSVVAERL